MRFRDWRGWLALGALLAGGAWSHAGEGPLFQVDVLDTKIIYTATPSDSDVPGFKPHINFPWLTKRGDGSLLVWFTIGQAHGVGLYGRGSVSNDNGQTWSPPSTTFPFAPYMVQMRPPGQISRGFIINFYPDPPTPFTTFTGSRFTSTDGGLTWAGYTAYFDTGGVPYISFYNNPGVLRQDGPTLMLTAFGQRPGESTFENVLFASTDSGAHWTRRATVMSYVAGPNASMGEEGPNESDIVLLTNGNLLSVSRTGQPMPNDNINAVLPSILWTLSTDHGYTWSPPRMLGVMGAFPHLHLLPSGHVAMSYGRYGVKVMFADPTGTRWSFPTVIHSALGSGQSSTSGYVQMHPTNDGKYVLAYDHSSFYPPSWDYSPPPGYVYANDQMAHMKAAILDMRPLTVFEDYNWLLEYHGDVTPDALPQPWTASQSGSVGAYLWADLGQDYVRTDTGPTRNGVTWDATFEGDVAPPTGSTPPWVQWDTQGAGAGQSSDGDLYTVNSLFTTAAVSYTQQTGWTGGGPARTVEIRTRVIPEAYEAGDGAAGLILGVNNLAYDLRFHTGRVSYNFNGLNTAVSLDTTQFHVYRIVIDQAANPVYSLYIDGSPAFTSNGYWFSSAGFDRIVFGDYSIGGLAGHTETDYISWKIGAHRPGAGGTSRSLCYTLTGAAGSAWQPIDFAAGMILETRARVGSTLTVEGSANVFLGDGVNGYVALELTGTGANLEGLNGNVGQVTYSTAGHPGFLTTDWHVYRLTIAPDPAAGGEIRAKLYLDSDHTTPILTQRLQPSAYDEIRFGDQTGTNNGIMDIDFLRFGHLVRIRGSDFDRDNDVDLSDFSRFQGCFNGPNQSPAPGCTADADLDDDGDVDLADFSEFQVCFNGPNQPPACP